MIKYPFVFDLDEVETEKSSKLVAIRLFVSSLDEAPEYYKGSCITVYSEQANVAAEVQELCTVTTDLIKDFPKTVFNEMWGPNGRYFRVEFELGLAFEQELEFTYFWKNEPRATVGAKFK